MPQTKRSTSNHTPTRDPLVVANYKPMRIKVGGKVILPISDGYGGPSIVVIQDPEGQDIPHMVVDAGPGWAYIKRL
jgi:hypothetical protein